MSAPPDVDDQPEPAPCRECGEVACRCDEAEGDEEDEIGQDAAAREAWGDYRYGAGNHA